MWDLGHALTDHELADYRLLFKKAKKQRKRIADLGVAPVEPSAREIVDEEPEFDRSFKRAKVAWLEVGSANAGGRDLEFPKAMMPFFELTGSREERKFQTIDGKKHTLAFTKREQNDMWRLMFNSASIHSAAGRATMRPVSGASRSDLVAVFTKRRGSKEFDLQLLNLTSSAFKSLAKQSKDINGEFLTTTARGGRRFGYH